MLNNQKDCVNFIHSLSKFGKKAGLNNITKLCEYLGNPQNELKFVHIAGTNGKGSVCAMVANIFKQKYKVGCFISPYIEVFNERIAINGENISEIDLVKYTNIVKCAVEALCITPIEFEFITAMGFLYFRDKKCDIVVLECGLGGRLDCTNIIKNPLCSVICAIGYDHTNILGNTIGEIAAEKSGIIKKNCPVVIYKWQHPDAAEQIQSKCRKMQTEIVNNDGIDAKNINCTLLGTTFDYKGNAYHLSLCGEYQVKNAITAIDTAKLLQNTFDISDDDIKIGIEGTEWKCRFEVIKSKNKIFVIDGAHNSHGIDAFVNSVNALLDGMPKTFVFGMLNDKDYTDSIKKICSIDDAKIIVTSVPSHRQTSGTQVYEKVREYRSDAIYIEDCKEAVEYADKHTADGAVCIFGSLYLCGNVRSTIKIKANSVNID